MTLSMQFIRMTLSIIAFSIKILLIMTPYVRLHSSMALGITKLNTQLNDTLYYDSQCYGAQYNDNQHNNFQHNDFQYNETFNNDTLQRVT
jgi:hypothetical protein